MCVADISAWSMKTVGAFFLAAHQKKSTRASRDRLRWQSRDAVADDDFSTARAFALVAGAAGHQSSVEISAAVRHRFPGTRWSALARSAHARLIFPIQENAKLLVRNRSRPVFAEAAANFVSRRVDRFRELRTARSEHRQCAPESTLQREGASLEVASSRHRECRPREKRRRCGHS